MSEAEIQTALAEIVRDVTRIPVDQVRPDASFTDDLDIDSLSMVEIVTAAEDKFAVRIPDEDYPSLRTVGDAVKYISAAAASQPA